FMRFWSWLGEERAQGLQYICSDMWKPYLKVIAYKSKKKGMKMMHLLDRFHIAKNMNMAIDKVRATESKELAAQGIEVLKNARWSILKRPENLTEIAEVLRIAVSEAGVNPLIKKRLCEEGKLTKAELRVIRPWYGHADHMHVRMQCPSDSEQCEKQKPLPKGDACSSLAW
ncbi:MAG: hypothetical protein GY811_22825, partial [Myxococcales bacterium]|nr:hypothetical protein [Myxococcales bacterium]